jgi:hypothetical protein
LEELKRFVATFSQKSALTMFRTVFTLPFGRAERVCGNLLTKIGLQCSGTVFSCRLEELKRLMATFSQKSAVTMFSNSVHKAAWKS